MSAHHKVKLSAGSMANQCGSCGALFRAVTTHTLHRIGKFGENRRCMTVDEMVNSGLKLNGRGQWVKVDEEALDRLHQYFSDDEPEDDERQ